MKISQNNNRFIEAKKLKQKKYRDEYRRFLVDGEKLFREALRNGVKVSEVFCTEEALKKYDVIKNYSEPLIVSEKMIADLCECVTPQGIVAVCEIPFCNAKEGSSVILENVQDPVNVGAIMRSAAAAGYSKVYFCNSADPYSLKALRAGMSAQFLLRIVICGIDEAISSEKEIFCAETDGEDVFSLNHIERKHAIIFGNEGNGVSANVKAKCRTLSLKMENGVESLNVASAAAVFMYLLKYKIEKDS